MALIVRAGTGARSSKKRSGGALIVGGRGLCFLRGGGDGEKNIHAVAWMLAV